MYIRSHNDPLLDWGNPENIKNFVSQEQFSIADTPLFISFYMNYIEKRRSDIFIIPDTTHEWGIEELTEKYPALVKNIDTIKAEGRFAYKHKLIYGNIGAFRIITDGIHGDLAEYPLPRGIAYELPLSRSAEKDARYVEKICFSGIYMLPGNMRSVFMSMIIILNSLMISILWRAVTAAS